MKLLHLVITINLAFVVIADPKVKHFYIESNKQKCALFDLSADISVIYSTNSGLKTTNLNMSQAQEDQHGLCDNGTSAVFNITLDPNLDAFVNFNFINSNQTVYLNSIQYGFKLSNNSYFPGASVSGYFSNSIYPNIRLSNVTNFYLCKSKFAISLSENVTLNIYFAKVQVFNVVNSSFGDGMDECQEDFINFTSTSTFPTTSSTLTSEIKTTATTVTKSTLSTSAISTSHTSKSAISTSHTSTSHTSTSAISTSHTSTSAISTSHSSTSPPTSSNLSTETSSKSSSFSFSTHLSTVSTKITTSSPISTTVNPQKPFIYAVRNNKTSDVCLLIESIIYTSITYETSKHKNETKKFYFSNSSYTGNCSPTTNIITIASVPDVSLTLNFSKIDGSSELTAIQLNYTLSNQSFPDNAHSGKNISENKIVNDCKVDASKGYKCKSLHYDVGKSTVVYFESFEYDAFRNTKDMKFNPDITNCLVPPPNSLVAIIVGVVLAVFLVIIVVVFLILRYRANKRKGYEEI